MFEREGRPFFPLGGQSHNSSAYNANEIESAIAGVLAVGGNTLEAPVYWEQLEPAEDAFDFSGLDSLVASCSDAGLALVILWFGTWKNGEMRYAPEWVKSDTVRFKRVISPDGVAMPVLSSYCADTRAADEKAFVALCRRVLELDPSARTVIAVQVENEPGILGSDRDYGPAAIAAVDEQLPADLVAYLTRNPDGSVAQAWSEQGRSKESTWSSTFGIHAPEFREAYSIAKYIDSVAAAGQRVLPRTMYTNAWLGQDGWPVPGFYPAGGPVARVLEIWKAATPHLATIAPDIYTTNLEGYTKVCGDYARHDNPLFIPESSANDSNAIAMLRAIADFNAVGFACFAVDSVLDLDGRLRSGQTLFAQSMTAVRSLLPLVAANRGTGRVHAVGLKSGARFESFSFERFMGAAPHGPVGVLGFVKDHRHGRAGFPHDYPIFGLIVETGPWEFYLAGHFHLYLVPSEPPAWRAAFRFPTIATPPDFLSVEEGIVHESGEFEPTRKRNGDEAVFGSFWCSPDSGAVRIRLTPND